jgi:hypothetical protein
MYSISSPRFVVSRLMAFAVSMLDPPPTATTASHGPLSRAASTASCRLTSVGSTCTPSYTCACTPYADIASATCCGQMVAATPASVTTRAGRAPLRQVEVALVSSTGPKLKVGRAVGKDVLVLGPWCSCWSRSSSSSSAGDRVDRSCPALRGVKRPGCRPKRRPSVPAGRTVSARRGPPPGGRTATDPCARQPGTRVRHARREPAHRGQPIDGPSPSDCGVLESGEGCGMPSSS